MSYERYWNAVATKVLTANGTMSGGVTVTDTVGFYVGQFVYLTAATLPNLELKVKRVYSKTLMAVGPASGSIDDRTNISAYTVALGAAVTANFQKRTQVPLNEANRAVFAEEPINAVRVLDVDEYGDAKRMQLSNPLITKPFDDILAGYPDVLTETYTYRMGGPAGTLVGVVTVTYTDATKDNLSHVAVVNY